MPYNYRITWIQWTKDNVIKMNTTEKLQYAVVGMCFNDWPEMEKLWSQILKQCKGMGDWTVAVLRNKHILNILSMKDNLVIMSSNNVFYYLDKESFFYSMRPLIYDVKFKVDDETTSAMVWFFFPGLKTIFLKANFLLPQQ